MLLTQIYSGLILFCSYFSLWGISHYLLVDPLLAVTFLPFALRLGIILHSKPSFWFAPFAAEFCFLLLLSLSLADLRYFGLLILSGLSALIAGYGQRYYQGKQWQKLSIQLIVILSTSLINAFFLHLFMTTFSYALLINLTGGLLVVPACYLLYDFLFAKKWIPVTARIVHKPFFFQIKHIIIYTILFILNIYVQMVLPLELRRFAPFCLAIPIILLAFRYGWQGALLGTLLNSIALIATTHGFSALDITDLLLSLSAQTITGIFLGLGIQYQRELNQGLSIELKRNQLLSRQLINTEEAIRKQISRELHDEIGQNITAIRTQATILKRLNTSPIQQQYADTIEQLSLNIYDTTKGLLGKIRPRLLDEFNLQESIQNMLLELNLEAHNIRVQMEWQNTKQVTLENSIEITLYRICQESVNNIIKHAQAHHIFISVQIAEQVKLTIEDDGIGFEPEKICTGFGLKGMQERIKMLNGHFKLESHTRYTLNGTKYPTGTKITITLPRL